MIEYIMWILSFFTLYISIVWLNFLYFTDFNKPKKATRLPSLTVAVPAYNEEEWISKTLDSLIKCDYPKDKLKLIVVNDGSTDNTEKKVNEYIKNHPEFNISLINKKNGGKAAAVNSALKIADTELFACLDADSIIGKRSIVHMIPHFHENSKTAAVITAIKVYKPKNIYEKMQRFEYLMAILMRKIRATINTLAMTPGVLSIYRTKVLKEVGGMDEGNMTEDFEIAMRLKYHGYNIQLEANSVTYTRVPNNFRELWNQRLRWFRGYLYNHYKYKDMFFSSKHNKIFSYFQLPLNIISIFVLILLIVLVSYGSVTYFFERIVRLLMIDGYIKSLFYIPTLKEFILSQNLKVMLPLYLGGISGIFLFILAHRLLKEKFKYPVAIWAYFVIFPYMSFMHWISSISEEILKLKRKW